MTPPRRKHSHPNDVLALATAAASAHGDERVAAVLARLREPPRVYADVVHVVDARQVVRGAVPLATLVAAAPERTLASLQQPVHGVAADADPEHVATLALRHGLGAVPVVDDAGRLLGVVTAHTLMEILRREHVEDLHRMAGIRRETALARTAIEAPPLRRARDRLPWLLLGLAGSALATALMASVEAALQAKVALAFFVPAIVYLADAIGTQTEAIAVRGLSLSHAPMRTLVWGELRTGLLIGAALGAVAWLLVWVAFADAALATTVAVSLLVAGAVATTVGLALPWLLARLGRDPAFGSGPLATIVQDVLSLAIYFAVAALLLG